LPFIGLLLAGIFGSALSIGGQGSGEQEIATRDEATFKIKAQRNEVLLRVIVRDSNGRAVSSLRKEDFRLTDNGKLQEIVQFAVESPAKTSANERQASRKESGEGGASESGPSNAIPANYQALFFDDVHMHFEDIARARDAADRYLTRTLNPADRVAIFTSSGHVNLDFTDDRSKLHEALFNLRPRPGPMAVLDSSDCPPHIDPYEAYLIARNHDSIATAAAQAQIAACEGSAPSVTVVQAMAESALTESEMEFMNVLQGLEQVVRRTALMPGRRSVILVSSGIFLFEHESRIDKVADRALRSNVVISALDARGLFTTFPGADSSGRFSSAALRSLLTDGVFISQTAPSSLAASTGGRFFHNDNDLDAGFRQAGTLSDASYMLSFSPQNLKYDGRFHKLKLKLVNPSGFSIQARAGYFAPKASEDAAANTKEEIEQAVFSQEELKELPADVHTKFFKVNESDVRLTVLTHLDLGSLRFRKELDRNLETLTLVTALFDRDGKLIDGKEKHLELRLRDTTLARLTPTGITLKVEFTLKPGTYLVRQVVRDSEAGQLTGLNRTVEIPY
jgi:VWFA-related protein